MSRLTCTLLAVAFAATQAFADTSGSGVGGAIPDDDAAGINSVASVSANEIIKEVSVTVEGLTHTWAGDVSITLTGPDNTSVDLVRRVGIATGPKPTCCGTSGDWAGNYTFEDGGDDIWLAAYEMVGTSLLIVDPIPEGTYNPSTNNFDGVTGPGSPAPVVSFTTLGDAFAGGSTMGDWTLNVSDGAAADTGSFNGFTVSFVSNPVPEPTGFALLGFGLLGLIRRRR